MKLIITRYMTAVDSSNPEKGNHIRYILETQIEGEVPTSIDNLGEFDLIEALIKKLS